MYDILTVAQKITIFSYLKQYYFKEKQTNILSQANSYADLDFFIGNTIQINDLVCSIDHYKKEQYWFLEVTEKSYHPMSQRLTAKYVIIRKKQKMKTIVNGSEYLDLIDLPNGNRKITLKTDEMDNPLLLNIISNRIYLPVIGLSDGEELSQNKEGATTTMKMVKTRQLTFYALILQHLKPEQFIITAYEKESYKIPVKDFKVKMEAIPNQANNLSKMVAFSVKHLEPYIIPPF